MESCTAPQEIREGDLLAYALGEASQSIQSHIRSCPACLAKADQLRKIARTLGKLMYRCDCPEAIILGQYQMDLLPSQEKLKVALHLRNCPNCTREIALLQETSTGLLDAILRIFNRAVKVTEAALVRPLGFQVLQSRGAESIRLAYHSENMDILIGIQPSTHGRQEALLLGGVVQSGQVEGRQVWLLRDDQITTSTVVDQQGTFEFENILPGTYNLVMDANDQVVLIKEVIVG